MKVDWSLLDRAFEKIYIYMYIYLNSPDIKVEGEFVEVPFYSK